MNVFVATIIRAILYGLSVWTGDKAWEDEELMGMVISAVIGIGTLAWSLLEKKQLLKRGSNPSTSVRLRAKKPVKTDPLLGEDPDERRRKK